VTGCRIKLSSAMDCPACNVSGPEEVLLFKATESDNPVQVGEGEPLCEVAGDVSNVCCSCCFSVDAHDSDTRELVGVAEPAA